jgi:putative thioredoxin
MTASTHVFDVSQIEFQTAVLDRSQEVPVLVDFWAPWCGPCRALGPLLVKEVEARGGRVLLAKLNTDENQELAARYRISGIPAVKLFRRGVVVDEFVGALPVQEIRRFLDKHVPSGEALALSEANQLLQEGKTEESLSQFRALVGQHPRLEGAQLGLVRAALALELLDEAKTARDALNPGTPARAEADSLLLLAELRADLAAFGGEEAARAALSHDEGDLAARWALAAACVARGAHEEALESFLEIVRRKRSFREDGARKAMLALFLSLGNEHPLTQSYRRKLSTALF